MVFIIAYLAQGSTREYIAMIPQHYQTRSDAQAVASRLGNGPLGPRKVVKCYVGMSGCRPADGNWPFPGHEDGGGNDAKL